MCSGKPPIFCVVLDAPTMAIERGLKREANEGCAAVFNLVVAIGIDVDYPERIAMQGCISLEECRNL